MDADDRTKAIMERAKQRKVELESEEGKENKNTDAKKFDSTTFAVTDSAKSNDHEKPRRSAFQELAKEYDDFAHQSPPKTRVATKEDFVKGKSPRLSIGETRPSVLCTPAGFAAVSRSPTKHHSHNGPAHISMKDSPKSYSKTSLKHDTEESRHIRFAHPISATSTYYEESSGSLNESSIVAGNLVNQSLHSLPNSSIRKHSDDINDSQECGAHLFIRKKTPTKSSSTSSVNARSPQPFVRGGSTSSFSRVLFNPSATSSPKTNEASAALEKEADSTVTLYQPPAIDSTLKTDLVKTNSSIPQNFSPIRTVALENAAAKNIAHMLEERIKETPKENVPIPKNYGIREYSTPASGFKTQWRGAADTPVVSGSTPGEPTKPDVRASNIKSLRNRWEFSSITGTPLHPDESEDALVQAALKMRDSALPIKVTSKVSSGKHDEPVYRNNTRSATASPAAKSPRFEHDRDFSNAVDVKTSRATQHREAPSAEDAVDDVKENQSSHGFEDSGNNISRFIDDAFEFMGSSPVKTPTTLAPVASPEITSTVSKKTSNEIINDSVDTTVSYDDNDDKKSAGLQYTISYYRKRARQEKVPDPNAEKIDLTMSYVSAPSQQVIGGNLAPPAETSNIDEIRRKLEEVIYAQKTKIHQASKALQLCRNKEQFHGSHEEATAQWAVLIETEIGRATEHELQRLNAHGLQSENGPLGSLTLTYLSIELSRDFLDTYSNIRPASIFYFCVIIRCAEKVLHSNIISSEEAEKRGAIEIVQPMVLKGLQTNFTAFLDIYSLRAIRAQYTHEEKFGLKGSTIKNKTAPRTSQRTSTDSSFQLVGRLALDIHVPNGKKRLLLSDVHYPLEGHITTKIKKMPMEKSTNAQSGFLSMYQRTKEGLGSWNRYWCVLENGEMKFWRSPEDEVNEKSWLVLLDLQTCAGEKEGASEVIDSCQYMHSFYIDVWVPKEGQDVELYNRTGRPEMEKLRVMLAADTKEDMRRWLEVINSTVKQLLTWNRPYAFAK